MVVAMAVTIVVAAMAVTAVELVPRFGCSNESLCTRGRHSRNRMRPQTVCPVGSTPLTARKSRCTRRHCGHTAPSTRGARAEVVQAVMAGDRLRRSSECLGTRGRQSHKRIRTPHDLHCSTRLMGRRSYRHHYGSCTDSSTVHTCSELAVTVGTTVQAVTNARGPKDGGREGHSSESLCTRGRHSRNRMRTQTLCPVGSTPPTARKSRCTRRRGGHTAPSTGPGH